MSIKKDSTAEDIKFIELLDEDIIATYKKLEEQCDLVLEKIKNRKNKQK